LWTHESADSTTVSLIDSGATDSSGVYWLGERVGGVFNVSGGDSAGGVTVYFHGGRTKLKSSADLTTDSSKTYFDLDPFDSLSIDTTGVYAFGVDSIPDVSNMLLKFEADSTNDTTEINGWLHIVY
jgi:hypothetical protein